jgi:hypothetical protein
MKASKGKTAVAACEAKRRLENFLNGTLSYGTVYRISNLICSFGFFARANHWFYRFRTLFRVRNGIVTLYGSCVRLISPSNLACARARARACLRARE